MSIVISSAQTPVTQSLSLEQGAPFSLSLVWNSPAGTPIDLTGYSAELLMATDLVNKTPLVLFTTGSGGASNTSLTLGGASGSISAYASAQATSDMVFASGVYALMVQDSSNNITKLMEGYVTLSYGLSWV